MPEPDDELHLLRAADPVDPASLPSARDPEARALFERITMTDTDTDTKPAGPQAVVPGFRRPRLVVAVAAAALIAVAGGVVALTRDSTTDRPGTQDVAEGPTPPGDAIAGSCVERYDLATLTHRELAFDGTVEGIEGDSITFTVHEWYRGGDTPSVTLGGATGLTGVTSAGPSIGVEPGARLLVAGDGGFAWSCGFTQPHDPAVADEWERALAG